MQKLPLGFIYEHLRDFVVECLPWETLMLANVGYSGSFP